MLSIAALGIRSTMFSLQSQQVFFALQPAGVADEPPVLAHHPVAGDYDQRGVAVVGRAHGAGRPGIAERCGYVLIAARLAVGDAPQLRPDALLELAAAQVQREVKVPQAACKIRLQLAARLAQELAFRVVRLAAGEGHARDAAGALRDAQEARRRGKDAVRLPSDGAAHRLGVGGTLRAGTG